MDVVEEEKQVVGVTEDDRDRVRWRPMIGCGKQPKKKKKNEDLLNLSLNPKSKRAHL